MRVTNSISDYPEDKLPTFQYPEQSDSKKRFLLGRLGGKPLFVICMNSSAASIDKTDKIVSRVINESVRLGYDGWCVANVYPLRGTVSLEVSKQPFDKALAEENCDVVVSFLQKHKIKEVWGAWGDSKQGDPLDLGKQMLLKKLKAQNVRIFYFGKLNKSANPHHLRGLSRLTVNEVNKHFLSY